MMVGQALWKSLKQLVNLDKSLSEAFSKIAKAKDILNKDISQVPKLQTEVDNYSKSYIDHKKNLDSLELTSKELEEKSLEVKSKLEKITNPKEYKAIEKEANSIELKMLENEELLEKAWYELQNIEKEKAKITTETKEKIDQLNNSIKIQEQFLTEQEILHTEILKKRDELLKNIPEEWQNKYENMKNLVVDPFVPVIGSACSSCYYIILRQDLAKLKQSGVVLCRNCYRFLYYDAEEEEIKKTESF